MNTPEDLANAAPRTFANDDVESVLEDRFYVGPGPGPVSAPRVKEEKPTHYKVICISMYTEALGKLDGMVRELKRRGYTKANRSALLRHAIELVDLNDVPRGL